MARQDNSPGRYPATTGLQFSADGNTWVDVASGVSPWAGSTNYKFVRVNPKLFDNKTVQPVQVLVKGSDVVNYAGDLENFTTPRGFATFGATFYQAVWSSSKKEARFALQPTAAADLLNYMIVMRELSASDRPENN